MINFRYHVVSLIAVFLAMGMGVLVGSSFISEGTVSVLRRNLQGLERTNERLSVEVSTLQKQNQALSVYAERTRPQIVRDRLRGRSVLLVGLEEGDGETFDEVGRAMVEAGASVEGGILLSSKLDLASETRRRQVAVALDVDESNEESLRKLLFERLAATFGTGGSFLDRLIDTDLAQRDDSDGFQPKPSESIPSKGAAVIIVGGPNGGLNEKVLAPLVRAIAANVIVAVCEERSDGSLLPGLREDSSVRTVTVDGIAGPVAQTALVGGLSAAFEGRFGHYGTGRGTASLLPEDTSQPGR